jgi:hypothetical protein
MITKHSEKVLPMSSGLLLPMSLDAHMVHGTRSGCGVVGKPGHRVTGTPNRLSAEANAQTGPTSLARAERSH